MADASYQQTSFLGGEWSKQSQGRADDPKYKTALNVSLNGFPTEDGAWVKRSGFRDRGPTRSGQGAKLLSLNISIGAPYEIELCPNELRIWSGDTPVQDSTAHVLNISASTPAVLFTDAGGAAWATGDDILITPTAGDHTAFGSLIGQQLRLTRIADGAFSLSDPSTNTAIDGSLVAWDGATMAANVGRILKFTTPWSGTDYLDVSPTTFKRQVFLFHTDHPPQVLTLGVNPTQGPELAFFTFAEVFWVNGPYFDPQPNQTATTSGLSGSVTVTFVGGFGPYQSVLVAGDVGRLVRLFNEPGDWDSGTTYNQASPAVKYQGLYYTALKATTAGLKPDRTPQEWSPNTGAAYWIWGEITAVLGDTQATVHLEIDLVYLNTIRTWRLGKFGDPAVGFPRCGAVHETRLWVDWDNSLNATVPDQPTFFNPTELDGTVTDASGISYTLESGDQDSNQIMWMISDAVGLLVATNAGEYVIKASSLDDPITAFSIQERRVTRYSAGTVRPVRAPLATIFVQRYGRKVMEFLADVFSGKYVAPNLATNARQATDGGVKELAYQEETTPIIWVRSASELRGATYRRNSAFITEAPAFTGWHRHTHGQGRTITGICALASPADVTTDALYAVTKGSGAFSHRVQRMVKTFDEEDVQQAGFFLDTGCVPTGLKDNTSSVTLYGLLPLASQTVRVMVGGIDCGDLAVTATGTVTVPYTTTFTAAFLADLGGATGEMGAPVSFVTSTTPVRSNTPTTIGNYTNSTAPESGTLTNNVVIPDFVNNRFITISWDFSSNATFAIRSYNLTSRAAVAHVNANTIFSSLATVYGAAITPDFYLMLQMDGTTASILQKIAPDTLTSVGSFGTSGSFFSPFSLEYSRCMAPLSAAGVSYLVSAGQQTGKVQVVNTNTMRLAGRPFAGTGATMMVRADTIAGAGSVLLFSGHVGIVPTYSAVIEQITATSGADTWFSSRSTWLNSTPYTTGQLVKYQGNGYIAVAGSTGVNPETDATAFENSWRLQENPYVQFATCGALAVAAVDPTWAPGGMFTMDAGYDRTDGTLILALHAGDGGVGNPHRLVKATRTGVVLWSTAIGAALTVTGLQKARIQGGRLGYMDAAGTVYAIDTRTGAIATSFTTHAGAVADQQLVDTFAGYLYGRFSYNSAVSQAPAQLSGTPTTFNEWAVYTPGTQLLANTSTLATSTVPALAGFTYNADGQLLRPGTAQDAGARNGPPQGKTRRNHMFAALLRNSQAVSFGTDFTKLRPAQFKTPGGTLYADTTLFSGVYQGTLDDDYSFDGMLAWRSNDPYPVTIVSLSGFLHTQDR